MRILLISQYFFPETGATSNRVYSLAKKFQEEGHDVRVIAEKSNHPEGVFFEGFENGLFIDQLYKGIPVTYSWVYARPEKSFLGRILFYVTFMLSAIVAALRVKGKFDIVCASSPPLFVGISGWIVALFKKARFVFDVRDLWPEVAVKMGELNNKIAITIAEKIENFLYNKADLITVVTKSFKKSISQKGISENKIDIVTNGTDPVLFYLDEAKQTLRHKLGLQNSFLVSYIGNIGLAQGLDHIINAASLIQEKGLNNISFLIVGDGPKKDELKLESKEKSVINITFIDRVALNKAIEYMNASDVLLVPLADDPIYSQFIPSKLFDSMAAAKPILLSVNGESKSILEKAEAGVYYEAENERQLVDAIIWLKEHAEEAGIMAKNGRTFVKNNYSRDIQAQHMLNSFKKISF